MKIIDKYAYKILWSEEDKEHVGLCLEFPSLSWLAQSIEDALCGIKKLVGETIKDMKTTGEEIPEPLSSKKYSGKFMVRVPPDCHKNLVLKASEENISLNRYVSSVLAQAN